MVDFSPLKAVLSGRVIVRSENAKDYQREVDETWNAAIRTRKPSAFVRVATVEDVVNTVKFCVKNEVMEKVIGGIYSVYTFILEENLLRFMLSILRLEFCLYFSNVHTKWWYLYSFKGAVAKPLYHLFNTNILKTVYTTEKN